MMCWFCFNNGSCRELWRKIYFSGHQNCTICRKLWSLQTWQKVGPNKLLATPETEPTSLVRELTKKQPWLEAGPSSTLCAEIFVGSRCKCLRTAAENVSRTFRTYLKVRRRKSLGARLNKSLCRALESGAEGKQAAPSLNMFAKQICYPQSSRHGCLKMYRSNENFAVRTERTHVAELKTNFN